MKLRSEGQIRDDEHDVDVAAGGARREHRNHEESVEEENEEHEFTLTGAY